MKNSIFEPRGKRSPVATVGLAIAAAFCLNPPTSSQAQPNEGPVPPQEIGRTVERQVHQLVAQATRDAQRERAEGQRQLTEGEPKPAYGRGEVMFRQQRPGGLTEERLHSIVGRGPGGGGPSLLIRTGDLDAKEQTQLEEDMAVMAHLLEKAVAEDPSQSWGQRKAMGIDLFFTPSSTPFRSMFIQDHGALFLVNVGFPLLPPARPETPASEKPSSDSDWEQARRELYGGRFGGERRIFGPSQPYDEEQVNKLKTQLLEALKNAANIRGLKNDDTITVCVFGGSLSAPMKVKTTSIGPAPKPGRPGQVEEREAVVIRSEDGPPGGGRRTMMTLQVKKADAEAFSKGKLDLDEFRKKARTTTYAGGEGGSDGPAGFGFGGSFGATLDSR